MTPSQYTLSQYTLSQYTSMTFELYDEGVTNAYTQNS